MSSVLFVIIVLGGGMLVLLSKTDIGRAVADRIRSQSAGAAPDPVMLEELERLRHDVGELQERMEFAERLLAAGRESGKLGSA